MSGKRFNDLLSKDHRKEFTSLLEKDLQFQGCLGLGLWRSAGGVTRPQERERSV